MPSVHFKPNVPVLLALRDIDAVPEGPRWRYTLTDGRDLVVTTELSASINLLELASGEPFGVCQYWDGDPKHVSEWNVWRTPQAEQARAIQEPEADLTPLLRESVQIVTRRKPGKDAGIATTVTAPPNGTHQPQAPTKPGQPRTQAPGKVPYNIALTEVLRFVKTSLKDAGEQWDNAAVQDLVSTVLITAAKAGHLTLWEREP